jgi:hypothetical protein
MARTDLEVHAHYEIHLDRKLERTPAMLIRRFCHVSRHLQRVALPPNLLITRSA